MEYVIYKFHCNITSEDYYGSTHNFKQRIGCHLVNTEKENAKSNCEAKKIINRGDFCVSIVETCEQNDKTFALWRERYYMETYPCINKVLPITTKEEKRANNAAYRELNKEHLKQKSFEYCESHRKEIRDRANQYYKNNCDEINLKHREAKYDCECGMKGISNAHRARHISAKIHQNYLINSISYIKPERTYDEMKNDKYMCACGGKYIHNNITTHSKTKRHQDYLINQSNRSNGSLSTEFKKE